MRAQGPHMEQSNMFRHVEAAEMIPLARNKFVFLPSEGLLVAQKPHSFGVGFWGSK